MWMLLEYGHHLSEFVFAHFFNSSINVKYFLLYVLRNLNRTNKHTLLILEIVLIGDGRLQLCNKLFYHHVTAFIASGITLVSTWNIGQSHC